MTKPTPYSKIICVVGLSGVGKSSAVRLITQHAPFEVVHFGGVVIDEVRRRALDVMPENEAMVREDLRKEFGMAVMAERSLPAIRRALAQGRNVLIDGLYSYSEQLLLNDQFGASVKVIAIHASKVVRAQRLAQRKVRPLTPDEMVARDQREIERLEKAPPIALADVHIVNDDDLETLDARLAPHVKGLLETAIP